MGLGEPPPEVFTLEVFLNDGGGFGYVVGGDVEGGEDAPCIWMSWL